MRRFLIPLLLATALTPAVAQARPDRPDKNSETRSERSVQRAERSKADSPERAERSADRPARVERSNVGHVAKVERAPRVEQVEQSADVDRPNRAERVQRSERPARAERARRAEQDVQPVHEVGTSQPARTSTTSQARPGSLADGFRQIGRGEVRHDNNDRDHDWSRDWRNNHRYDWHNHRRHHSSLFRLGRYYDPYGWGYRRWSIGFSLWPSYYGSNYWLNDPWMYRLPPAFGPYRWVRYYDDALLVNTYTGQVVDVIYNFFW